MQISFNPVALKTAKTLWPFGCCECNRVNAFSFALTLLLSEWPKLYGVLAVLSSIGLMVILSAKGLKCIRHYIKKVPVMFGRAVQSVGHLTRKSGDLGSIPGLATYFRFSFRFFKKGSCQFLAKVCAQSIG